MMWPLVMTISKAGVWAERMADVNRRMKVDRTQIHFREDRLSMIVLLTTNSLLVIRGLPWRAEVCT